MLLEKLRFQKPCLLLQTQYYSCITTHKGKPLRQAELLPVHSSL